MGAAIAALCSFAYAKAPVAPYAGRLTPVSAESRTAPRQSANAPLRSGSIRADVARYNEERGSTRTMQRQSDDPRPPDGSPYRN